MSIFNPVIFLYMFLKFVFFSLLDAWEPSLYPSFTDFLPGPLCLSPFFSFPPVSFPPKSWYLQEWRFLWQRDHGLDKSGNQNYLGFFQKPMALFYAPCKLITEAKSPSTDWKETWREGHGWCATQAKMTFSLSALTEETSAWRMTRRVRVSLRVDQGPFVAQCVGIFKSRFSGPWLIDSDSRILSSILWSCFCMLLENQR